jgi:hypothetical protein
VELLASSEDVAARRLATEPGVAGDVLAAATVEASLTAADVTGGTSPARVAASIVAARQRIVAARKGSAGGGTGRGRPAADATG